MIGWRHTVRHGSLKLAFILCYFCETHDLVWEIISVSEKRKKNCIVKIIDVFEEMTKVGYVIMSFNLGASTADVISASQLKVPRNVNEKVLILNKQDIHFQVP